MATKEPTVERRHREAAIKLCHGNPARCCRDWAEFGTAPELHTTATRIAQVLADTEAAAAAKAVEPFVLLRDWETRTSFGEVGLPQRMHDGTFRMYATVPGKTPVIGQGTDVSAVAYELCRMLGLLPSEPRAAP